MDYLQLIARNSKLLTPNSPLTTPNSKLTIQTSHMKLTIFGATTLVGLHLVKQALIAGHTVTAYGRNVHELIDMQEQNENLHLVKGGLFDKSDIEAAIKGADVVLSALGGATDGSDNTRSLGMKYIVEVMEKKEVNRIVALGGYGCLQADEDTLLAETESFPEQLKAVTEEHLKALHNLRTSDLEWSFLCPPTIVEGDVTGLYHTKADYAFENTVSLNAGDVAQCMLSEAVQNNYIHVKFGMGN
jgi:uncharacterized protein